MYKKQKHNPSQYMRARNANALPLWANHEAIIEIFDSCPYNYHVDHIIPITSNLVCGLHVAENLQIIKGHDNLSKSNKFTSYIEDKNGERVYVDFEPPKRFYTMKPTPTTGSWILQEYWEEVEKEKARKWESEYGEFEGKYSIEFKKFKVKKKKPYLGGMYPMPD